MTKKLFAQRMQHKAMEWRDDRRSELRALIQINEHMIASYSDEYEQLGNLTVPQLMALYGWQKPEELERQNKKREEWIHKLGLLFCEHIGRKNNE